MKKIRFICLTAMLALSISYLSAAGSDVVVLMDTSGTILPYFEDINSRILTEVARKFVRPGDTFHLVSFNARVNLEIAQSIRTESDISRIVSRFMLLYPLGQNSDFLSGIQYTHQYVSSLNQATRKIIIIISDGIFNPPAGSTYAALSTDQVKTELSSMAARIRADGWSVYYIKIPYPANAEIRNLDGQLVSSVDQQNIAEGEAAGSQNIKQYQAISEDFTAALDISPTALPTGDDAPLSFVDSLFSMPEITFPGYLGREGRYLTIPLRVKNLSKQLMNLELTGVIWNGQNILRNNAFLSLRPAKAGKLRAQLRLPNDLPTGAQELPVTLEFSQNLRVSPQTGVLSFKLVHFTPMSLILALGPVFSALLLILIALILIVLLVRFLHLATSQPAARALRNAGSGNAEPASTQQLNASRNESDRAQASILASAAASKEKTDYRSLIGQAKTGKEAFNAQSSETSKKESGETLAGAVAPKTDYRGVMAAAAGSRNTPDLSSLGAFEQARAVEKQERLALLTAAAHKVDRHGAFTAARAGEPVQITANRNIMLELIVNNQNPHIGKRNIHVMKPGTRLSLGGKFSSFLVFLVRFPASIAEVRFDGSQCNLAILKPRYFPEAKTSIIEDCIGKEITLLSDRDYEVKFTLREYEDPVLKLNRLLRSITFENYQ